METGLVLHRRFIPNYGMETATNDADLVYRIEESSLNAWPALQTEMYRGAILRFADGYSKRSNSVNALYFRGDIDDLILHAETAYRRMKLPTVFKILDLPAYNSLDAALAARGYDRVDATTVKTCDLAARAWPRHEDVSVKSGFSQAWLDGYIGANFLEPKRGTVETMLGNILADKFVASVKSGEELIAFGFGVVEDGRVGFFDIHVKADHRGRGLGRKIMEAIIAVAADKGAAGDRGTIGDRGVSTGYLQVMDNNLPANALYDKLGFAPLYRYLYRRKNAAAV